MATMPPPQPLTHERVLRLALPIMLSGATVPLLGAVDTAVVGQSGEAALIGAVGIGSVILSSLYWIFGFLRMGTTGLAGQAAGAGDEIEVSAVLARALLVAVVGGVALILLQSLLFWGAFALSPASETVEALARNYLHIRIWTAPAAIAVYALTGWLVAMERTRDVLVLQLAMNGANILLDVIFVLGFDWGVPGVALATVIAEMLGLGLALWLCRGAFDNGVWRDWPLVLDRDKLIRMAKINSDILLRSAMLLAIFVSFTFWGARFGDVTLASNQVLMQFLTISAFALDGFAYAAEALVARAVGRADADRLNRSTWLCWLWGMVSAVVMTLLFMVLGTWLIDLIAKDPLVQLDARRYIIWVALSPLLGVTAFIFDGVFIGATRGPDMRNMMAISLAIYLLAALALMPMLGNHGLWLAMSISFVARGVTLGLRYPALERDVARSTPTA